MLRELYCIFLSSLRYIKIWIVRFYRGLKFPHRTVVLLALETGAACTRLCGHSARRKSEMFVLVWCYKPTCDTEQDLWKYWLPEGWFSSGSTSLCVMVAPARSVAGGGMNHWHCCIWYLGQVLWCAVCRHKVQKHFWSTPLTRITIDVADSSVLPLLSLRSLSGLSGCHIIDICVGHQDVKLRLTHWHTQAPVRRSEPSMSYLLILAFCQ